MRYFNGEVSLANAARPDQRQQPAVRVLQQVGDLAELLVATEQWSRWNRQRPADTN
jgi:hypothetical protein